MAVDWFRGFLGVGLLEFKIRLPDFEETQLDLSEPANLAYSQSLHPLFQSITLHHSLRF